jgi:hypothetical protein
MYRYFSLAKQKRGMILWLNSNDPIYFLSLGRTWQIRDDNLEVIYARNLPHHR